MDLNKKYSVDVDNIDYRIIGNKTVILNVNSAYFYTLDEVGTAIWKELVKQKTLNEIAALMMEEYDVNEDELKHDIVELVNEMDKEKLIKPQ